MKKIFKLKNYKIKRYENKDFNKISDLICKFQKEAKLVDLSAIEDQIPQRLKRAEIEIFLKKYNHNHYVKYIGVDTDSNEIFLFCIFKIGQNEDSLVFTAKNSEFALTSLVVKAFKEIINLYCNNYDTQVLCSPLTRRDNYEKYVKFMLRTFNAEIVHTEKDVTKIKYKIPLDI